jgi:hypothetical protein
VTITINRLHLRTKLWLVFVGQRFDGLGTAVHPRDVWQRSHSALGLALAACGRSAVLLVVEAAKFVIRSSDALRKTVTAVEADPMPAQASMALERAGFRERI